MKRHLKPAFLIALVVLACIGISSYALHLHREFQAKVEWSVLQAADLNNRNNSEPSNVILYSDSQHHLAGIINAGEKPVLSEHAEVDRVWILLDPKYPPAVKILDTEGGKGPA
jgi:hypothetical protein